MLPRKTRGQDRSFPWPKPIRNHRLSSADLGEKRIAFNKNGNSVHVHGKIMECFPALVAAGVYELLRTSDKNSKQ